MKYNFNIIKRPESPPKITGNIEMINPKRQQLLSSFL
jgi:hypothetical protein